MSNLNNECSCRGENPNCFKCEGTGIVTYSISNYIVVNSSSKKTKKHDQFAINSKESKKKFKTVKSTTNSKKTVTPEAQKTSQPDLKNPSVKSFSSMKIIKGEITQHLNIINHKSHNTVTCPLCKSITKSLSEHLVVCLNNINPEYLKKVYCEIMSLQELDSVVKIEIEEKNDKPAIIRNKKNDKGIIQKPINFKLSSQRYDLIKKAISHKSFSKLFKGKVCYFCKSNFTSIVSHLIHCNSLQHLTIDELNRILSTTNKSLIKSSSTCLDLEKEKLTMKIQIELCAKSNHFSCPFCNKFASNFYEHARICTVYKQLSIPVLKGILKRKFSKPLLNSRKLESSNFNVMKKKASQFNQSNSEKFNYKVQDRVERRMDASKDFFTFRENGRYGSHPVHDDYGEDGEV